MKGLEDFKEDLMYDSELADYLYGADSVEEIAEKAREKGYEITADALQQDELTEDIFESVCGGDSREYFHTENIQGNSTITDLSKDKLAVLLWANGSITEEQAEKLLGGNYK